mmetsp:Transcript_19611/g.40979  ORF Transcript_19611/g.40979 Transcript_19611/m.40979 type:complete len:250 (+) Transcript_19611:93-842(+)
MNVVTVLFIVLTPVPITVLVTVIAFFTAPFTGPRRGAGRTLSHTIFASLETLALKPSHNSFMERPAGLRRLALSAFPREDSGSASRSITSSGGVSSSDWEGMVSPTVARGADSVLEAASTVGSSGDEAAASSTTGSSAADDAVASSTTGSSATLLTMSSTATSDTSTGTFPVSPTPPASPTSPTSPTSPPSPPSPASLACSASSSARRSGFSSKSLFNSASSSKHCFAASTYSVCVNSTPLERASSKPR